MRLLLDTNILIELSSGGQDRLPHKMLSAIESSENACTASVVSLWEIAIKMRIGKLDTGQSARDVGIYFDTASIPFLPITREQALADLELQPNTRDPFDRLLLAICQCEGLRLVTLDRVLAEHPLAWR
jgi:PIN domain nuclease of toxin-antitoxin system